MGADQNTRLGDQQQVLAAVHHLDAHHWAGLFGDHIVLDAQAAPVCDPVLLHGGALAVSIFCDGQHGPALGSPAGPHHIVALPQADPSDTHCGPAHGTDVLLIKAHSHSVMGGDQNLLGPVGLQDADQLVALVQGQGPDAAGPDILQG